MTRDGNSCLGHSMKGLLAICALLAMAAGACADEGDGIQPFSKTQRTVLKEVKTWEIRVVESFGSAPGFAGVTAESECRALFKEAGMTVVPTGKGPSDARLHVSVSGRALSAYYHATPSQRYSGAEVKVDGWVEVSGKTLLKFRQSSYSTSTPYSISGGYTEPKEAPFPRAYASCRHTLFSQLLMLVHATNGVEPVLAVMKMKKDHEYREAGLCCFAVVKDRAAVPTLCDMLLESA
ncbi:hypothetical protein HQ560_18885, partial [bacterium]|nr:hypothetical protein [bacterium]